MNTSTAAPSPSTREYSPPSSHGLFLSHAEHSVEAKTEGWNDLSTPMEAACPTRHHQCS